MQIMNITNYSNSKQNQPAFGMVLDFTPATIKRIGIRNFEQLARDVKPWVTEGDAYELTVKGTTKRKGDVLLSTEDGCSKAQTTCFATVDSIRRYLKKFNVFCS